MYEGDWKDDKREGKRINIILMAIDMKVIIKIIKKKEKESINRF